MNKTTLPTEVVIDGAAYKINQAGNFEIVIDILKAFSDRQLDNQEKFYVALSIFYNFQIPDNYKKATEEMLFFIRRSQNMGTDNRPVLMDWNQDFDLIADAVIPILGYDVRTPGKYTHWWTLLGAYYQIGDSPFATVVSIRSKKQKRKRLTKEEQEFYSANKDMIELSTIQFSSEEEQFFKELLDGNLIE